MKKILAVVLCALLTGSCLVVLSSCGKQDLTNSQYLGTWKATSAKFKDEDVDIKEVLNDDDFIVTLKGDGTATVYDPDGDTAANWKETSKGVKVKGDDINVKMIWLGDGFDVSIFGFHLILTKVNEGGEEATGTFKAGVWAVIEEGKETGATYTFTDNMKECSYDNGITGIGFDYEIQGNDYVFHMGAADDNTLANVIFTDDENCTVAWAERGVTETLKYIGETNASENTDTERHMIINSEPVVITAKDGFDNAGVTELICDATEKYSFTKSDDSTTWEIFVLDEKFDDGARYLAQAQKPALEGDGTLTIEEGKYIYILCSESAFTDDSASEATLTIDYAGEDADDVTPDKLFAKGVWSASIDGKVDTYFIFDDNANGRTERADGTGGTPFTCEQNGYDVVFHFGSADDVTEAKFSTGDNTGTFKYGEKTVVYTFELVADADPATFEVPAAQ